MSSHHRTRTAVRKTGRYNHRATVAQKVAGLSRIIYFGHTIRSACEWVNSHSEKGAEHKLTKSTLGDLYKSLPTLLRIPSSSDYSETALMDFLQQQQSEARQHLGQCLSLLSPLEEDMLCQWIQARANMNLPPEKGEVIQTARTIILQMRGSPYEGYNNTCTPLAHYDRFIL
jgi:hypothetical protein